MMHDWVISTINIDYDKNDINITFKTPSGNQQFIASEFAEVHMPKRNEWGPSSSVLQVEAPKRLRNNNFEISIQLQSGDTITIEAKEFMLPEEC